MATILDRTTPPAVSPLPRLTLPHPEESILRCGARLMTLRDATCDPEVFHISILVDGAGYSEAPSASMMRVYPRMIDQGTNGLSANDIMEVMEGAGAWYRFSNTSHFTQLQFQGLNDTAHTVLPVLAAMLATPSFEEERLMAIREMTAQEYEIQSRKPVEMAKAKLAQQFWGPTNPNGRQPDGEEIRSVNRDMLLDFHRLSTIAPRMTIYLSGHLTDELIAAVADAFDAAFPAAPAGFDAAFRPIISPVDTTPGEFRLTKEGSRQAAILLARPAIMRTDPDYDMLRLAITGLGGYFGSRLVNNLREERGLTYGITASLSATMDGSISTIQTECRRDSADEALEEIRREIRRFVDNPPEGEELERLKSFYASRLAAIFDTPFSIADHWMFFQSVGIDPGYFDRSQDVIATATPQTLSDVMARHILSPELAILAL